MTRIFSGNKFTKMKLFILFVLVNCTTLKNQSIKDLKFPATEFESGFVSGSYEINSVYFDSWCKKNCERLKTNLENNKNLFLEITVRMDATEQPEQMILISKNRAESLKNKFIQNGFPKERLLAKANLDTKNFIGKDKFDPVNRTASFKFVEKN